MKGQRDDAEMYKNDPLISQRLAAIRGGALNSGEGLRCDGAVCDNGVNEM